MSVWLRLIVSFFAGLAAALCGFGIIALFFLVTRIDPGIGGGLMALLAGLACAIGGAIAAFRRLSRDPGR